MPYRRSRSRQSFRPRQTGARTGASFSGMQDIIRHSNSVTATIQTGYTQCFNLVCYNPTFHGTPLALDGSTAKVLTNNFTDLGSRVNNIAIELTIKQTDTSKNNTCYTGLISTSFNEGQLSAALMTTNFNDFIKSNTAGEMVNKSAEQTYSVDEYRLKDIQQHNIRGLLNKQFQLYSGRVITVNQVLKVPGKCRRSQNGMFLGLVVLNDSGSMTAGTDVEVRIDTFFKEIPADVA
jgi:hypothetical protein